MLFRAGCKRYLNKPIIIFRKFCTSITVSDDLLTDRQLLEYDTKDQDVFSKNHDKGKSNKLL
jgi:hypothetical protein